MKQWKKIDPDNPPREKVVVYLHGSDKIMYCIREDEENYWYDDNDILDDSGIQPEDYCEIPQIDEVIISKEEYDRLKEIYCGT